jgi:hypothetical protein
MTAPTEPPGAHDEPDMDALYSLADEGKQAAHAAPATIRCPSCQADMEPGASLCMGCGFNLKTGTKARAKAASTGGGAYMPAGGGAAVAAVPGVAGGAFAAFGAPRRGLQKDEITENNLLDYYIPIGLIAAGLVLTVLQHMKFDGNTLAMPGAVMVAGAKLVISFVLLAVAAIFCIKWGDIAFGAPGPAAMKMAGIALAPAAIAQIIGYLIHDLWGLVAFFLAFGMFFILFHYLFEWDMSEKWVVTGIACVVCMLATPFIAQYSLSGAAIPGFTIADKGTSDEDNALNYMVYELGTAKPAREWIDEHSGRQIGDLPRGTSVELIDDLYALGPKKGEIYILVSDGPQAGEVLVLLPGDSKKRQAFFDYMEEFATKNKAGGVRTKEGDWMVIPFAPVIYHEPPDIF